MTDRTQIRTALTEVRDQISHGVEDRDALIAAGDRARIPKTELAELTGLSRQTIYDILTKQAVQAKAAEKSEVAATEAMWKMGQVIEDRWGLRWRADFNMRTATNAWFCRSVGLRISRTHERMAERGPFKLIRVDRVFGGDEARTARKVGEAEDAAVTVGGDASEDHDQPDHTLLEIADVCPEHRIPDAAGNPVATPIPGCLACAAWLARVKTG